MTDRAQLDLILVQSLLVCAPVLCALWVLRDARSRANRGHPVAVYVKTMSLETPEAWAIACLLMFIVVLPLYLTARSNG